MGNDTHKRFSIGIGNLLNGFQFFYYAQVFPSNNGKEETQTDNISFQEYFTIKKIGIVKISVACFLNTYDCSTVLLSFTHANLILGYFTNNEHIFWILILLT